MKGFTLVELLAVIVILAIISLLVVPSVISLISSTEDEIIKANETFMIEQTKSYVITNMNLYEKTSGNVYCINLETLKVAKFLDSNFVSSLPEEQENSVVKVTVTDEYNYTLVYDNSCVEVNN